MVVAVVEEVLLVLWMVPREEEVEAAEWAGVSKRWAWPPAREAWVPLPEREFLVAVVAMI